VNENPLPIPLHTFNFELRFHQLASNGTTASHPAICSGRFSEVSGLEATMEPKTIHEGGRNFGEIQRVGAVKFATVILKRGITRAPDLWKWFELVAEGKSAIRLNAELIQFSADRQEQILRWTMRDALPVKFKAANYIASSSEVGIEELHFVHEHLSLEMGTRASSASAS